MTMLWFVSSLLIAIIKMKGHVFTKIHKKTRLVIQNNLTQQLILAIIIGKLKFICIFAIHIIIKRINYNNYDSST